MNAGSTDRPSVTVSTTKIEITVHATRPVWAIVTPGGYHIASEAPPLAGETTAPELAPPR
jgi:hypothetical protein